MNSVKHQMAFYAMILCLTIIPSYALAQASAKVASATPVTKSTARGTSILIRQNQLNIYKANLERQLKVAQRCVEVSRLPVLLRDPQGNVNQVPKTDIVFCSRQIKVLTREIAAVSKQLADLSKDAVPAANYLARRAAEAALARRLGLESTASSE